MSVVIPQPNLAKGYCHQFAVCPSIHFSFRSLTLQHKEFESRCSVWWFCILRAQRSSKIRKMCPLFNKIISRINYEKLIISFSDTMQHMYISHICMMTMLQLRVLVYFTCLHNENTAGHYLKLWFSSVKYKFKLFILYSSCK